MSDEAKTIMLEAQIAAIEHEIKAAAYRTGFLDAVTWLMRTKTPRMADRAARDGAEQYMKSISLDATGDSNE